MTAGGRNAVVFVCAVAFVASACGGSSSKGTVRDEPSPSPSDRRFSPGIYYRTPALDSPAARLVLSSGDDLPELTLPPGGFDIRGDVLVTVDGNRIDLVDPSGTRRTVEIPGLFFMARPSLAPDAGRVALQASERDAPGPPQDLNIYVVDLATRSFERISPSAFNEESPEWFPGDDRIAYVLFDPSDPEGLSVHVYDLADGKEVQVIRGAGGSHLAVAPDGARILDPVNLKEYDTATGSMTADLRAEVVAGLRAAGFEPDERFPGQAGQGLFPLDADYAPEGSMIVLDGAVRRGDQYGTLLFTVDRRGGGFQALGDPIEVNPNFSNQLNYSQLNPSWL